jgi:signal transduction histidine kinase
MKQNNSPPTKILIVDDNEAIHNDFKAVLSSHHEGEDHLADDESILFGETEQVTVKAFQIDSAFQGEEAVEKVRQASEEGQHYAVAFVDVRMPPGIDGIETAERIWQIDPHVQVVLCTAYSDYSWKDLIKRFGETDRLLIMKKPFESIEAKQIAVALSEKWILMNQLEKRIQERTRKLEQINKELEQFSYVVSHDLKAPLRGIHTLIDWIVEDCSGTLSEEVQDNIALLKNRAQRMQNLIDSILEYSRAENCLEEKKAVDLNEIVSEVVDLIQPPENIDITISTALPTIFMGETHAFQLLQNLLSNAVKHMDKPQGLIQVDCERIEGFWKFSITDNGPGIAEQHFEKIFNLFQTLRPRDEFESTGVGLAVVKKMVTLYGGQVGVESEIGKGSTFWFTVADLINEEKNEDATAHITAGR